MGVCGICAVPFDVETVAIGTTGLTSDVAMEAVKVGLKGVGKEVSVVLEDDWLSSDDRDEMVSGGLNSIVRRKGGGSTVAVKV